MRYNLGPEVVQCPICRTGVRETVCSQGLLILVCQWFADILYGGLDYNFSIVMNERWQWVAFNLFNAKMLLYGESMNLQVVIYARLILPVRVGLIHC